MKSCLLALALGSMTAVGCVVTTDNNPNSPSHVSGPSRTGAGTVHQPSSTGATPVANTPAKVSPATNVAPGATTAAATPVATAAPTTTTTPVAATAGTATTGTGGPAGGRQGPVVAATGTGTATTPAPTTTSTSGPAPKTNPKLEVDKSKTPTGSPAPSVSTPPATVIAPK
jgi:hypothetical protein